MAGPYPGYGPQAASVAAYEPSWFERLIAALATDKSAPEVDAPSGVEYPAGVSAKPLLELSGLAGAARLTANVRAGHPVTNINAPSYAGQYGDVLDTVGLAAPAVALGMKGLAKGAGAVADSFVANSGPRARQRGAIRAGGDERLIPSHATDLRGLERARDSLGPNMIYSPSIGINLNKVNRFQDQNSEGTIYLIPKIGAFDPATSASVLYNRDAYLPRHGSYAINQWGGGKTGENLAFDKGLANLRLIGGEGKQIPKSNPESIQMSWSNTAGHKAALANSPHFRSFAQYESSPAGMATLVEGPKQLVKDAVEPLYNSYRTEIREAAEELGIPFQSSKDEARLSALYRPLLYGSRAERLQLLEGLKNSVGPKAAETFSNIAAKYRQRFSRVPAEYAELQPQGLTPLTEENWAGAMVAGKDAGMRARGLLKNLPVEYFEPGTLTADAMKRFQGEYGLARRQPIGQRLQLPREYRGIPKTPAPYLTGLAGTHKWPQKGAQKAPVWSGEGLPDAASHFNTKVEPAFLKDMANALPNQEFAEDHLKYLAETLPTITGTASKEEYSNALSATLQVMKQKGWKPAPEMNKLLAGLDGVFSPKVAMPVKVGKPPVWVPDGVWIPDDHLVELLKFAGQANNTDLQQALVDYSKLHPDDVADGTPIHNAAFEKVQAAFAKVPKPWQSWGESGTVTADAWAALGKSTPSGKTKPGKPMEVAMPDLLGETPTPAGVLDKVLGKDWDVAAPSGQVAQTIIDHWGTKVKTDIFDAAIAKAPSWEQDNIIKSFLAKGGKWDHTKGVPVAPLSLDEQVANWHKSGQIGPNPASKAKKPLPSTGDAALDAEIDALAKDLEPADGTPETELSPTGIPWKNIAGSFKDHEADVIGGGTTTGEDIANFIELLKEAGLGVAKGLDAGGAKGVQISALDGSMTTFVPSAAWGPWEYQDIVKQFLPKVWVHMQAKP